MSGMIHPRNPQAPAFPLLSQNSEKVIKTLSYAADLSKSKNCLSRHGLSTAYGMKALAISFFNAFAYLAFGLYHFTKEVCHCNWSQALKMLGKDAADSAKSFAFSIVCVGIVALGVIFPKTMYSCFTARQIETPKVKLEIPQKEKTILPIASIQTDTTDKKISKRSTPVSVPADAREILKKRPRILQLVPPCTKSQEKLRLAKLQKTTEKVPVSTLEKRPLITEIIPKEFSNLPKVIIQQVFPFLSDNTQKNLSYVSRSLYHYKKELIRVVTIGNEAFWNHFTTSQKLFDHYQHYKNVTEIKFGEGSITTERMQLLAGAMKKGCFPELRTLTIGSGAFNNSTEDDLRIILSALPKLTRLRLPRDFTDEQLAVIARSCPSLEEVHFSSSAHITEKGVIHFFEHHKKLKKLTLDIDLGNEAFTPKALDFIWTNLQELQNLDIHSQEFQDPHYKTFAGLPTSLVSLKFSSTGLATDAGFENFPFLPELKHLHISHGQCVLKLTDATFLHIAKQCPNLHYLGLKGVRIRTHKDLKGLSEQTLIQILSRYPNLVYLDLSQIEDLTDATLLTIGQLLPKLRFLDLHLSDGFTTEGLDHLGQHCKLITHVNLKNAIRMGFTYTIQELTKIFPNLKYGLYSENQPSHFPEADLLKAGFPSWET